ncbi:MAG: heme o synthase [Bryobacteraceae bacterium]
MKDYIELTKPRITWLILMSTGIGYLFGYVTGVSWWMPLLWTLLGTGLVASGTAALNQWYEREADLKMRRTAQRPIPAGRIGARPAFWFGVALSVAGFGVLAGGVNLLSGLLCLLTEVMYLGIYTPLKQRTHLSTVIGALPGAMPPMIGYAAARGELTVEAWILFAILFLWQFPHFLAIAWMYREDYARAGILMLPVVQPGGEATARQMVLYSMALIPVSLAPSLLGMTGQVYLAGAFVLGVAFLYAGVRAALDRSIFRARRVLLTSVVYLPLIYGLMVFDRPGF